MKKPLFTKTKALIVVSVTHLIVIFTIFFFLGGNPVNRIGFAISMAALPIVFALPCKRWRASVLVYVVGAGVIHVLMYVLKG